MEPVITLDEKATEPVSLKGNKPTAVEVAAAEAALEPEEGGSASEDDEEDEEDPGLMYSVIRARGIMPSLAAGEVI